MTNLIMNYESYILNESNMENYLKYKLTDLTEQKKDNKTVNQINKSTINKNVFNNKPTLFIPREQDTLFWCYYIIKNGDINYEMLKNRNKLTEKQIKIEYVTKIRQPDAKKIIKIHKFDTITNLENNLANDINININTFMSLCAVDNINIIFIKKNTYYEFLNNDSNVIYIIREISNGQSEYVKKYGYELASEEEINNIRNSLYKVDSISKPIKALSSYKVSDLLEISNKLAIETINKQTGKNKSKNELYESIIQYF
jgi:hypothetical protein